MKQNIAFPGAKNFTLYKNKLSQWILQNHRHVTVTGDAVFMKSLSFNDIH